MKKDEERLHLSFSDVSAVLKKARRQIVLTALLCAFLGFAFALTRPIRYMAEGSFKEKGLKENNLSLSSSLIQFLNSNNQGPESEASTLMLSRAILQNVVDDLHLQANLTTDNGTEGRLSLIRSNLQLSLWSLTNRVLPVIRDPVCPISFSSFSYTGEIPLSFRLCLHKDGTFDLFENSPIKTCAGKGKLSEPFHFQTLSFVLKQDNESKSLCPQYFNLTVNPLVETTKAIEKNLVIEPDKQDKNLLKIKYFHRNRHIAAQTLNALMASYQSYTEQHHKMIADKQLDYLNIRRDQLRKNLVSSMEQHADFLTHDLSTSGFVESNKEMEFLAKSQHEYKRKLLDNELEIKRLSSVKPDNFAHLERVSSNEGDLSIVNSIFSEMRALKQQRDALEIEIQRKSNSIGSDLQTHFNEQVSELKDVQNTLEQLNHLQEEFEKTGTFIPNNSLLENPKFLFKNWSQRLQNASRDSSKVIQETKDNFLFYLKNLQRLLSVHERVLQERLTHQQNNLGEYAGINLEVATDLYRDYSKQLIQIENNIKQNTFFIKQIEDPKFEITSLSAGVNDPVSSEIIQKAGNLILNLRDQNNQSVKEQERIKEELSLERNFLSLHLQQVVQLMQLNKQVLEEKLFALQNVSLELIHQRISLLEKNLQDYLNSRLSNLEQERVLVSKHLENISYEMAKLPRKWVSEQLLSQEVATNHLIVEEIAKLVETKNISHNLEVLQSAPVDLALPPVHPLPPKTFLLTLLGALVGMSLGSCFALATALSKGLPLSEAHLKQLGCHVSGSLSSIASAEQATQEDIETLRRLQHYFEEDKETELAELILMIEGKGPHYTPLLAYLISKKGNRVLVIDVDPGASQGSEPGLFEYLHGKVGSPALQKRVFGDYLPAGEKDSFASELLTSPEFSRLLGSLRPHYDWILCVSRNSLESIEAEILSSQFTSLSLTIDETHISNLYFYLQAQKTKKISFLLS